MEAKQEAKELVEKFYKIIKGQLIYPNKTVNYKAKQCALICVDEILKEYKFLKLHQIKGKYEYWQEVKQEIHKL